MEVKGGERYLPLDIMSLHSAERDNLTRWQNQAPFYEVYYLKWNNVAEQTAFWLRYTLLTPKGRPPEASLWGMYFDGKDPKKNFFIKETVPFDQVKFEPYFFFISIKSSSLFQEGARGSLKQGNHSLEWDLQFTDSISLRHYPTPLYFLPLPKTKFLAPHLSMKVTGTIVVDGKTLTLQQLPGHQAHFWGTQQASRWAWAHCNTFDDPQVVLEALTAQISLGTKLSPPLTLFFVSVDGQRYACHQPYHWWKNRSTYDQQSWHLEATSGPYYFVVDLTAHPEDQMKVPYEDPDGSQRLCLSTHLADVQLDILKKSDGHWNLSRRCIATRSAAFEVVETVT